MTRMSYDLGRGKAGSTELRRHLRGVDVASGNMCLDIG